MILLTDTLNQDIHTAAFIGIYPRSAYLYI